jgi:hypothetical protein
MSTEMVSTIQTALLTAGLGILAVLTIFIKSWLEVKNLKNQAEKIKIEQEIKQTQTEFGLKRLDYIVTNIVSEIEQKKITGVNLTEFEKVRLFETAKIEIKSQVQPEIMEAVADIVKDPDRYIETKIETAIGVLKDRKV